MSMVPSYIEVSAETLKEILEDNDILDDIIYNGDHKLTSLDLIDLNTYNSIFSTLSQFIEKDNSEEEENEDENVEEDEDDILTYDDFPGYHISYEIPEEVQKWFETLKKIPRAKIEEQEQWLLEWFDEMYNFYHTASKNGSAVLYCIT